MGVSKAGFAERVLRTYKHTVTHSGARRVSCPREVRRDGPLS